MTRIAFLTSGPKHNCLEKLVKERERVCVVILSNNDITLKSAEPIMSLARNHNIPVCLVGKANLADVLYRFEPEIAVLVQFRQVLSTEEINIPKYCINIHPSLLPKYRGHWAISRMLEDHEKETGVTVHYLDEGIDTGDILLQKTVPIHPEDNEMTLRKKLLRQEVEVMYEAIGLLKSGAAPRISQDQL